MLRQTENKREIKDLPKSRQGGTPFTRKPLCKIASPIQEFIMEVVKL